MVFILVPIFDNELYLSYKYFDRGHDFGFLLNFIMLLIFLIWLFLI